MKKNLLILGSLAVILSSCLSAQQEETVDAMMDSMPQKAEPYVEAYIEYPGPNSKWGGPAPLILHIQARKLRAVEISLKSDLFQVPNATIVGRGLASAGISTEAAREELGHLADSMMQGREEFRGCLYPVRARLVRADGAVLERSGCRGQQGWPKEASQTVAQFVAAAGFGKK